MRQRSRALSQALAIRERRTRGESHVVSVNINRLGEVDTELQGANLACVSALRENERLRMLLDLLLDGLGVGVVANDAEGRVILVNRMIETFVGIDRQRILGHPLPSVWRHAGLPEPPFSAVAHRGRILTCSASSMNGHEPIAGACVWTLYDVSDATRLKGQRDRQERLAAMGEMVGRLAHEIRNPLGSIELFASLLAKSAQEEDRQSLVHHISTSIRTLNQLLSNLLVVTGPPRPRIQQVDMSVMVDEITTLAMQAIRERSISLQTKIDEPAQKLHADGTLLRQALLNILLNAIQASPQGGHVEITCRRLDARPRDGSMPEAIGSSGTVDVVALSVRDGGIGIPGEDLPRIFDPFFSRREGGTGLGLAIVHQVMNAHNGWIDVDSYPGKGTTMILCFPQTRGAA